MKSPSSSATFLAALLASLPLLLAQPDPSSDGDRPRPRTVEERLDRMKKDLELTEEQVTKIKPILAEAREKMDELRGKLDNDRDALREQGKAIWDETRAKIDEVLTADQRKKADELRAQRGAKRGDRAKESKESKE